MNFSSCQNRVPGNECVIFNPLKEANLHVLCKMLPDNTVQTASERKQRMCGMPEQLFSETKDNRVS